MQAVVLRVRAEHVETVMDRLLPVAPLGIYDRDLGPFVELVLPGATPADVPDDYAVEERTLSDDPERRLAELMPPPVIAGRFVIRPAAARPPADRRLEDIVIERGSAFGTGLHPTTRRCLELLLAVEAGGSFADLGCGTGVLGIAAARLGWSPVTAVDYDAASVESARANAAANGVAVEARRVDLLSEPPPEASTVVANVPAHVQAAVRSSLALTGVPRHLVLSGVDPTEADSLAEAYRELGLEERRRFVEADWAAVLLTPPDAAVRATPRTPARRAVPPAPPAAADELPTTLVGQLESTLPDGRLALSSSRDLPTGARVAVLLAPGLFRLDLRHLEDTLKISIRNLSGTPIRSLPAGGPPRTILTSDDVTIKRPVATNARLRLIVGTGSSARGVDVVLSSLSGLEPGVGRVTAQAIAGGVVRHGA